MCVLGLGSESNVWGLGFEVSGLVSILGRRVRVLELKCRV